MIPNRIKAFLHRHEITFLAAPLPASLMISAIQYTLVERLVSELTTSTLTPSSMSPQHFPIGALKRAEEAAKWLRWTVTNQALQQGQQHFHSHAWNSSLALQSCYCYRCTDPSQSSLQGPLQIKSHRLEPVYYNERRSATLLQCERIPAFDLDWFCWLAWYWA